MESASHGRTVGMGVRCLVNGSWGFAATNSLEEGIALESVENAVKLARASRPKKRGAVELADCEVVEDKVRGEFKINPNDVDQEEKLRIALKAEEVARTYSDDVVATDCGYADSFERKYFASSEGSYIEFEGARTYLGMGVTAKSGDVLSPARESIGGTMGLELFQMRPPHEVARTAAKRAVDLLGADPPSPGRYQVILNPKLLGLLVHEAFGHCSEADLVLSGDVLSGKIGREIASDLVTIADDAGPKGANGWVPYDDEGVRGQKTVIVNRGVLESYLHNRETAKIFGVEPTGNARAQGYSYEPIIRMRNTYMEPGDWKFEEMLQETKSGLYLKGGMGGQADANGVFMFGVQEGYEIRNGDLARPVRGITISGNAIDVLKSVDAVGDDFRLEFPGICGKMQSCPVDGGGPHIRCEMMVGGRT